ncbi:MAG: hypothetical protein ACLT98_14460 [Eggerthellaceae bacterium]
MTTSGKELPRRCSVAEEAWSRRASILRADPSRGRAVCSTHTTVTLDVRQLRTFDYPLVGKFNVENVMCAFGIGLQLLPGRDHRRSARGGAADPGRLEP